MFLFPIVKARHVADGRWLFFDRLLPWRLHRAVDASSTAQPLLFPPDGTPSRPLRQLRYPVATATSVKNDEAKFPRVTFCSVNPISVAKLRAGCVQY